MKFDSNRAWKRASAQVSANRDVLMALAGVFFLLPGLAFGLFLPQPQPAPGMASDEMMALARNYYLQALPFVVPMLLLQAIGTLAMLTLVTERRPTVGESIRHGLAGIVPYILAQLLLGLTIGLVAAVILALAAVSGSTALLAVLVIAIAVAVLYAAVKTSLVAPVIAVEGERNPLAALRRSWRLTRGNSVRIALFYLLVAVAFIIVMSIVMGVVGIILALVAGTTAAEVAAAVVSATLGAIMSVYFVAILAAVHRQLAGPTLEQERATFE